MIKNKIQKKILLFTFYIIIPLLIITAAIIIILMQRKYYIFPNPKFNKDTFTDMGENGKSEINDFKIYSDKLIMSYTLKKGFLYPYIGLQFHKTRFFNIKKYDFLKIKIKTTTSKIIRIYLELYIDNFTDFNKPLTFLYLIKEIPVMQNKEEYIFALKDFKIPEWWYDVNNISEYDKRVKKDFTKTAFINIENDSNHPVDIKDTITLGEISFYQNKLKVIFISGIILFIYLLIISLFHLIKAYNKRIIEKSNKIIIPYKYLDLESYIDEETKKILKYIGANYNDPGISVEKVSYGSGVPALKIPKILKKRFGLSFPQYINTIRLLEAKRLLKNTDIQITEIAYNVGYNSLPHFNRIFKNLEKCSPQQFRKENTAVNNKNK